MRIILITKKKILALSYINKLKSFKSGRKRQRGIVFQEN